MTSDGLANKTEDGDGSCAICADVYVDPRLLPCRHTFCLDCLERWHASSHQRHYFSCPICREKVWVPHLGVQGFRSNYFVRSQRQKRTCSLCRTTDADVHRCNYCDQLICKVCRTTHGSGSSKNNEPCYFGQEEEIVTEEDTTLRATISALRPVTRSCCYAEVIGGFQCSAGVSEMKVNKIIPVSATEAWILFDNDPAIYKYDINGMVTDVKSAEGTVIDIGLHPDGPLLFIQEYSNSVWVCGDDYTAPIEYVKVGDYLPTSFLVEDEGSLIVAVMPMDDRQNVCYLLYFNQERKLTNKTTLTGEFTRISSLALDISSRRVCVTEEKFRVVHVLPKRRVITYRRSSAFPIRSGSGGLSRTRFTPRAVCSGLHDSYLVLDGGSGFIHILNTSACLTSVVVTDDQEHIGDPNTIALGRDDRLWVGDGRDGMVRVYYLNAFINYLEAGNSELDLPSRNTGGFYGSILPADSSLPEEQVSLPDMSVTAPFIFNDTVGANASGPIQVVGGLNGIQIILPDTGTAEGNRREQERILQMIHKNDILRKSIEMAGTSVDSLGPANFSFKNPLELQLPSGTNAQQFGGFFPGPNPSEGNFPLHHGFGGVSFFTGNRERDLELLENFLISHPSVREDMTRKGITPAMIVDFPHFLNRYTSNT
ncbi:uncharacterized protein [Argopecten irradians]|uniref:uncharacterized protein n=1 Tax=Argopecten irradians TaxID=31199 RepID=UPI00371750D7